MVVDHKSMGPARERSGGILGREAVSSSKSLRVRQPILQGQYHSVTTLFAKLAYARESVLDKDS